MKIKTNTRIINKDHAEGSKLIRFHHPTQDLTKVCTLVDLFYNGNIIEDKFFFLEKQDIKNNVFDFVIPENKHKVKIKVSNSRGDYDLEQLNVEFI